MLAVFIQDHCRSEMLRVTQLTCFWEPCALVILTCPFFAEGVTGVISAPGGDGHIVEAAWGEGAERTLADRLGNGEGLNHLAVVGEGHHVVIHISRSWQPGNTEVIITAGIVDRDSTHAGRDCEFAQGGRIVNENRIASLN